jgi:pyruvate-formate lyase-activating enzyme
MAKDDGYFIKVHNPRQARRVILENTRDVLKVLQGYEDFKKVREQRTQLISTFKNNAAEIRSLVFDLRRMLPKTAVKEMRKTVMPQAIAQQKPIKELKKLEQELADIESKLSEL